MINIKSNEEKIISFEFQVEGSRETPSVRLIIEGVNDDFDLSIPASIKNGKIEAKIPQLEHVIPDISGTKKLKARIEAIVDDTFFETWSDDIIVEQTVKVKTKQTEIRTENKKPKITATLTEVNTVETKPLSEIKTTDGKKYKLTGDFIECSSKSTPGRMYPKTVIDEGCAEEKPKKKTPKKKISIEEKFENMLSD